MTSANAFEEAAAPSAGGAANVSTAKAKRAATRVNDFAICRSILELEPNRKAPKWAPDCGGFVVRSPGPKKVLSKRRPRPLRRRRRDVRARRSRRGASALARARAQRKLDSTFRRGRPDESNARCPPRRSQKRQGTERPRRGSNSGRQSRRPERAPLHGAA